MDWMSPEERSALARTILGPTLHVRRGESVLIESWTNSLGAAEAVQLEARRKGARPLTVFESEPAYWQAVEEGRAKEIGTPGPAEWAAIGKAGAYVYFWGPTDRPRVDGLDPKIRARLTAYNDRFYALAAKKRLRGVRVELALAEPANAARYGVDLAAWRKELLASSLIDPGVMIRSASRLRRPLERGRVAHVTHPNGTDVTIALRHRKLVVDDASVDEADLRSGNNIASLPGGFAVVPVEGGAEGEFRSNRPTRFQGRVRTDGAVWTFSSGRLAGMKYDAGGTEVEDRYRASKKGKEKVGLLEIGLNPALHDAPSFEDQEAGVVTLYLGRNRFYGGQNSSDFFAAAPLSGATLEVDGRTLISGGRLR